MALRMVGKGASSRAVTYKQLEQIGVDPRGAIDNPDEVLAKINGGGKIPSFTAEDEQKISSVVEQYLNAPAQYQKEKVTVAENLKKNLAKVKDAFDKEEAKFRKVNEKKPKDVVDAMLSKTLQKPSSPYANFGVKGAWDKYQVIVKTKTMFEEAIRRTELALKDKK